MGNLQGIRALVESFTAFPVKHENTLVEVPNYLPPVPLIGYVTGLVMETVVGIYRFMFRAAVITGILRLGFLVYVNGVRYTIGVTEVAF